MEQLAVGLWRAPDVSAVETHGALLGEWTEAALANDETIALTVNIADADQGIFANRADDVGLVPNADAMIVVGLGTAHDLDDLPARDLLHQVARHVDVWRIISHARKTGDRVTVDGERSPGVKMVSFMERGEGLTHAQFVRHWTETHTLLALEHHVGMWYYTQHVVRRAYTPGGRAIDGIAELHFRSRDDFEQKFFDSDSGRDVIMADVPRFMRRRRGADVLTTEFIMRSAP